MNIPGYDSWKLASPYDDEETEIGSYDDTCEGCRKEITVSIYSEDQTEWDCPVCEYTNEVRSEE